MERWLIWPLAFPCTAHPGVLPPQPGFMWRGQPRDTSPGSLPSHRAGETSLLILRPSLSFHKHLQTRTMLSACGQLRIHMHLVAYASDLLAMC